MPDHDPHDPWASLAESLGAVPASEPTPPRPAPPPRTPPKQRSEPRPKPAAGGGNWDSLASDLGLGAGAAEPVRPAPRPAEPVRGRSEMDDRPPRSDAPRPEAARSDEPRAERPPRITVGEDRREGDAGDDRGERRGRRRRGRRGGRGRGRREDDRLPQADDREPGHAAEARSTEDRGWDDDAPRGRRPEGGDRDERASETAPHDAFAADLFAPAAQDADREGEPRDGRATDQEDGDRPRRRRRRGRRGGRGRSRDESREPVSGRDSGERREPPADGGDDEPLPAGYGVRPAARPADASVRGGDEAAAAAGDDAAGERRGRRRRRRRRGGEGRGTTPREGSGSGTAAGSARGRRGRRSEGGSRSSSSVSRGRRTDFAPVAGGYDEDDEGLEFLGIEEAGRDAPRRETHPEDDAILAESGLNTVRDVPSWVEAIGIVIAGNLDARSRPRSERGDDERRRR